MVSVDYITRLKFWSVLSLISICRHFIHLTYMVPNFQYYQVQIFIGSNFINIIIVAMVVTSIKEGELNILLNFTHS